MRTRNRSASLDEMDLRLKDLNIYDVLAECYRPKSSSLPTGRFISPVCLGSTFDHWGRVKKNGGFYSKLTGLYREHPVCKLEGCATALSCSVRSKLFGLHTGPPPTLHFKLTDTSLARISRICLHVSSSSLLLSNLELSDAQSL